MSGDARRVEGSSSSSSTVLLDPAAFLEDWKRQIKGKGNIPANQQRLVFASKCPKKKRNDLGNLNRSRKPHILDGAICTNLLNDLQTWHAILHFDSGSVKLLHPLVLTEKDYLASGLYSKTAEELRQVGVPCNVFYLSFYKWIPLTCFGGAQHDIEENMHIQVDNNILEKSLFIELYGQLNGRVLPFPIRYYLEGRELAVKMSILEQTVQYRKGQKIRHQLINPGVNESCTSDLQDTGAGIESFPEFQPSSLGAEDLLIHFHKSQEFAVILSKEFHHLKCIVLTVITIPSGELQCFKQSTPMYCEQGNLKNHQSEPSVDSRKYVSYSVQKSSGRSSSLLLETKKKKHGLTRENFDGHHECCEPVLKSLVTEKHTSSLVFPAEPTKRKKKKKVKRSVLEKNSSMSKGNIGETLKDQNADAAYSKESNEMGIDGSNERTYSVSCMLEASDGGSVSEISKVIMKTENKVRSSHVPYVDSNIIVGESTRQKSIFYVPKTHFVSCYPSSVVNSVNHISNTEPCDSSCSFTGQDYDSDIPSRSFSTGSSRSGKSDNQIQKSKGQAYEITFGTPKCIVLSQDRMAKTSDKNAKKADYLFWQSSLKHVTGKQKKRRPSSVVNELVQERHSPNNRGTSALSNFLYLQYSRNAAPKPHDNVDPLNSPIEHKHYLQSIASPGCHENIFKLQRESGDGDKSAPLHFKNVVNLGGYHGLRWLKKGENFRPPLAERLILCHIDSLGSMGSKVKMDCISDCSHDEAVDLPSSEGEAKEAISYVTKSVVDGKKIGTLSPERLPNSLPEERESDISLKQRPETTLELHLDTSKISPCMKEDPSKKHKAPFADHQLETCRKLVCPCKRLTAQLKHSCIRNESMKAAGNTESHPRGAFDRSRTAECHTSTYYTCSNIETTEKNSFCSQPVIRNRISQIGEQSSDFAQENCSSMNSDTSCTVTQDIGIDDIIMVTSTLLLPTKEVTNLIYSESKWNCCDVTEARKCSYSRIEPTMEYTSDSIELGQSDLYELTCKLLKAIHTSFESKSVSDSLFNSTGSRLAEFEKLLQAVAPTFEIPQLTTRDINSRGSCFTEDLHMTWMKPGAHFVCRCQFVDVALSTIWQWYELPSCFGVAVRTLNFQQSGWSKNNENHFQAFFVPYLSGIQIFGSQKVFPTGTTKLDGKVEKGKDVISKDEDTCEACSCQLGSNMQNINLLFEFFDGEKPHQRRTCYDRLKELIDGKVHPDSHSSGDPSILNSLKLGEIHPASWFSIAWYPVYRIPDGTFRAAFLTYHSLSHFMCSCQLSHSSHCCADCSSNKVTSPVVGLTSYNAMAEKWFSLSSFYKDVQVESGDCATNPSQVLQQHLTNLRETAAILARGKDNQDGIEKTYKHLDYNFFLNRQS